VESVDSFTLLAVAFGLGLLLNAAPGPVFAETVRRGVSGGFRAALAVQAGSIVGDAAWAAIGLLSIGLLLQLDSLRLPIGIAGSLYLVWLAIDSWRSARHEFAMRESGSPPGHREALTTGLLLSLTNPQHLAYWAAIGSALGSLGLAHPTFAHYATFFGGFLLSSIVWAFVMSALVDRLFKRIGVRWARFTYRACAIALLALALSMARELWMLGSPAHGRKTPALALPGPRD
jgi:chemosensory pili system protein ChpE